MEDKTPNWIKEAGDAFLSSITKEEGWAKAYMILERVNTLLCIACDETENEFLHEAIMKEISYEKAEI